MNELQKLANRANSQYTKYAIEQRKIIEDWYAEEVLEGRAIGAYDAKDIPFDRTGWFNNSSAVTTTTMLDASKVGLSGSYIIADLQKTSEYFLGLHVDGVTLSESLRNSAKYAEQITIDTLNKHIKNKTTVKRLRDELTSRKVSRGDLPKYITDIREAVYDSTGKTSEIKRLIKEAERNIAKLNNRGTTKQLQTAYIKVIKAVEKGDAKALSDALQVAIDRKAVYNNNRIARTEISRANSMAFKRRLIDHPDYAEGNVYVRNELSSAHPKPDVCDYYAHADNYNLGRGVYPVGDAPMIPLHANCLCNQQIVVRHDIDMRKHQFSKEREEKYYEGLSGKRRKQIERSKQQSTILKLKPLPKDQLIKQ